MEMTIYTADCSGNEKNSLYPNVCQINSEDALKSAVSKDHVTAKFHRSHRSSSDFESSDCEVMDCDNDHSDDPAEWVTQDDIAELLDDVSFAIVPSRHDGKEKDGKSARPRFHVYFPHGIMTKAADSAALKKKIFEAFSFFDGNALDAARFIYGAPCETLLWHEGMLTIDEFLAESGDAHTSSIPQGQRNSTMSRFAGRVLKRYGISERSHGIFMDEAAKCDPPLPESELSKIWSSACRFAKKVQSQEGYVPPEEYEFENESLKPADYSDIGQAKALVKEYKDELKFTPATDFIRYDGYRWVESKQRAVGAMEEFLDLQLEDAKDELDHAFKALMSAGVSEEKIKSGGKTLEKVIEAEQMKAYSAYLSARSYMAFVMKRRDMKYVLSALQAAKPMIEVEYEKLDGDAYLLNCPDGTYDLSTGIKGRHDHKASDLITKMTAAPPGDDGKQIWLSFIDTIFLGDNELIDYVQMIAGISAIGEVDLEALIISYGEGSNGKSTFWNTVAGVLGDYSGSISADTLTVGCRRNVKPELAEAKGRRLLIAAELEEGMRLSTSIVKQLCSTDKISAEKKYKDPSSFTPSHTLVLYTNHLPRVGAMDSGTWRRLIVIPFNARITGKSDIKNYSRYLLDNASPYVMKWIIEGAKKAIDAGFSFREPECVRETIEKYKDDSNWLEHFLDDCCDIGEACSERSGKLYEEYRAYCQRTGEFTRSTTEFYAAVEQRGFVRVKKRAGIIILGLKLRLTDFVE